MIYIALLLNDIGLFFILFSVFLDAIQTPECHENISNFHQSDMAYIYDGMVLIQQLQNIPLVTFGDVSEFLLKQILKYSSVAYFVTDRYFSGSVKSFVRRHRNENSNIRYKIERRDQKKVKQWAKYLRNPENKNELVEFLAKDWSDPHRFSSLIRGRTLFVNVHEQFFKLTCPNTEVSVLF